MERFRVMSGGVKTKPAGVGFRLGSFLFRSKLARGGPAKVTGAAGWPSVSLPCVGHFSWHSRSWLVKAPVHSIDSSPIYIAGRMLEKLPG